jgi:N6-L-threonylcarbamoyladenine synthase
MALILGIETSCDETAAAVVQDGCTVLSNVVASQDALHLEYGGVVPEIASRAHLERILPVIEQALNQSGKTLQELDAIAVGNRPGLIGSLLVGVAAAKSLSWSLDIPLVTVDHVIAHLWASRLDGVHIEYPAMGVVVSGGHTALLLMHDPTEVECLGKTIDDAAGEAFDKAAAILLLGWPGGPKIDAAAAKGTPVHRLPRPKTKGDRPDFSFSGLKTALLYGVRGNPSQQNGKSVFPRNADELTDSEINDWAASFQEAAVDSVIAGFHHALTHHDVRCVVAGGGVLANSLLREKLTTTASSFNIPIHLPDNSYCVDNAAMIAGLGFHLFAKGQHDSLHVTASPRSIAS